MMKKTQGAIASADESINTIAIDEERTRLIEGISKLETQISALEDENISRIYGLFKCELQGQSEPESLRHLTQLTQSFASSRSSGQQSKATSEPSTGDVANFVRCMSRDMVKLCMDKDLKFLAYLVDMARTEAGNILAKTQGS